jgi:hypothetical protein
MGRRQYHAFAARGRRALVALQTEAPATLLDATMASPNSEPTGRFGSFTPMHADAMLRSSFISKGRKEVLAVPAKVKKGTKKKATPKKK